MTTCLEKSQNVPIADADASEIENQTHPVETYGYSGGKKQQSEEQSSTNYIGRMFDFTTKLLALDMIV